MHAPELRPERPRISSLRLFETMARDITEKHHVLHLFRHSIAIQCSHIFDNHELHLFRHSVAIQCSHIFDTNTLDIYDNAFRRLLTGNSAIPKLLSCLH